ncbi:723_t:CDS:2 [Gigaspora rosea]|nr:723_t:CDS:2 [Gigaspora rosea]
MNNEGESSQAPKFEIESEPSSPTKLPKPTKLPDDLKVESFLPSPDSKYAVTYNRKENELYQSISFKFDCLINIEEFNVVLWQNLVAVSM